MLILFCSNKKYYYICLRTNNNTLEKMEITVTHYTKYLSADLLTFLNYDRMKKYDNSTDYFYSSLERARQDVMEAVKATVLMLEHDSSFEYRQDLFKIGGSTIIEITY